MAAEALSKAGLRVDVFDAMPSLGRKFLLAGIGGLNLTHSEPRDAFHARFGARRDHLAPLLDAFGATELRAWAHDLGVDTFVGSSGRVFPTEMKAAPLLRAWLHRLREAGIRFHVRHRWQGWSDDAADATSGARQILRFATPQGDVRVEADAVILALGGGSWTKLGSDGAWVPLLSARGVAISPLRPANCGFDIGPTACSGATPGWSEHFRSRFSGQPLKSVTLRHTDANGTVQERAGECMISATGIEGGLIYAVSAQLRDRIETDGFARIELDLTPGRSLARLSEELSRPRGSRSMSSHLQSKVGLAGVKAALLRESVPLETFDSPAALATAIKALPISLAATRPLDEAISSAGGVHFEALDAQLMIRELPGVFCAGEMLDWEAPTGGYLLTGCFASGYAAGLGASRWLSERVASPHTN
jgi:uncharacterized flavoprotein (TIGR03862 family)